MKKFMSTKMKVFMATILIGSITCFISAFVVLGNSGYTLSNYIEEIDNFVWDWNYNFNYHRNFNSSSTIFTQDSSSINNIDVNLSTYSADIITSDATSNIEIIAQYDSLNANNKLISTSVTDGTLNLSSLNGINSNDVHFTITIPSTYKGNLSIVTANGDIDLSQLTTTKLSVKSLNSDVRLGNVISDEITIGLTNGSIHLNNNKSKNIVINSINSEMNIYDNFENIKITNTNGDIDLVVPSEMKNCEINNINGDIELHSNPSLGFALNYETISGDMEKNIGESVSYSKTLGKHSLNKGNADSNIFIKTVSGDLSVD